MLSLFYLCFHVCQWNNEFADELFISVTTSQVNTDVLWTGLLMTKVLFKLG